MGFCELNPKAALRVVYPLLRERKVLTPYTCCALVHRAERIEPAWVALYTSRGHESAAHKLFMRATGTARVGRLMMDADTSALVAHPCSLPPCLLACPAGLGTEPRVLGALDKCLATEHHPGFFIFCLDAGSSWSCPNLNPKILLPQLPKYLESQAGATELGFTIVLNDFKNCMTARGVVA